MKVEELDKEVLVKIVKAVVAYNAKEDGKVQFLQDYIDIVDKHIDIDCAIYRGINNSSHIYEFYYKGAK